MRYSGLIGSIRAESTVSEFPDGSRYMGLSTEKTFALARELKISPRLIEIEALENGIFPNRYIRNFKSFSPEDQVRLLKSTAAVVGLGGLGGGVVEILARIGVGGLVLMDGDVFDDSNLNRQLYSTHARIGCSKAETAARRVGEINGSVQVAFHDEFLDGQNAERLLADADIVVDCLDNVITRFIVQEAAKRLKRPMVSAAVAGATGQLTTIFPGDEGLRLIYGDPKEIPGKGAEEFLGCLPHAVSFFSSLECAEVVKVLLKRGKNLRNSLMLVDLDSNSFEVMRLF